MLKVVHIHTDIKFIHAYKRFECDLFSNINIVIGKISKENRKEGFKYYSTRKRSLNKIVDISKDADLVVLYGLENKKAYIANRLPLKVAIAWRFFGYEIYRLNKNVVLSPLSKKYIKSLTLYSGINYIKNVFNVEKVLSFIQRKTHNKNEFSFAVKRINFFLGIFEEEYDYLKTLWGELPTFIPLPKDVFLKYAVDSNIQKDNFILVGNSRSPFNNHFDVLDIIVSSDKFNNYKFLFPFSYVSESSYSLLLRQKIRKFRNISLLESFMPLDLYQQTVSKCSAAVYNSYRQMAMGNIWYAIRSGVKVYLSKNNPVYHWFVRNGFKVSNVDSLLSDMNNNSIILSDEEHRTNYRLMKELAESNTTKMFQESMYNRLLAKS